MPEQLWIPTLLISAGVSYLSGLVHQIQRLLEILHIKRPFLNLQFMAPTIAQGQICSCVRAQIATSCILNQQIDRRLAVLKLRGKQT